MIDQFRLIHKELKQSGATIEMADSLIAGIAINRNAMLITRNRKHYERIPGLNLGLSVS
jgi:predicted nucleic acid-binding protein